MLQINRLAVLLLRVLVVLLIELHRVFAVPFLVEQDFLGRRFHFLVALLQGLVQQGSLLLLGGGLSCWGRLVRFLDQSCGAGSAASLLHHQLLLRGD